MSEDTKSIIAGIVRHGLTIGAGYLAARGIHVDDSTIQTLAAAVVAVGGIAWSVMQKKDKAA